MKNKITLNKSHLGFMMSILLAASLSGQVKNNGTFYVADNGIVYISNGLVNFSGTAISKTTRTTNNYGVMAFSSLASASNASDTHFLNGYARTYNTSLFIAPIGDGSVYAPAKVTSSVADTGVDLAYFYSDPTAPSAIGSTLSNELHAVSEVEYWVIKGAASKISLSWRSTSNVDALPFISSDEYITLVGFKDNKWVEVPSTIDGTSFLGGTSNTSTNGSITSNSTVNLADFTAFTIGAKKELPCFPEVVSSEITKTWTATGWSPSTPTIIDPVVLEVDYDGLTEGSFACFSVDMGEHNITLGDDNTLEVATGFTGDGQVIMSSKAIVLQRDGTTTSGPNIVMTKITNPMRRYDYVFLSSPINNMTTFFNDLLDNDKAAVDGDFGLKPNSAFEQLRTFDALGLTATDANVANTPIGRGFSATVRNQSPYSSSMAAEAWYSQKETIHIKTEGKANNGNVEVVVPANGWVRIGNPYPSPIDGSRLLDAMGSKVRQTLYYWTYSTPRGTIAATSYNNASFATWNRSGGTAATESDYEPNGYVGTMQSVLTKAMTDQGSTTFNITNCMRTLTGNEDNLKSFNTDGNGKFRLNLVGSADSFSQILVSYDAQNGTLDYDNGYDSQRLSGLSSELSSVLDNGRYAIQTRPEFELTDIVPLHLDKRTDETFTINLASTEGVFETTPIYLHDKTLGIYHDLSNAGYSFIQNDSADSSRFEIVYENSTLSTGEFNTKSAFAFISENQFRAQASTDISEIAVYDIAGRLIITYSGINQQGFSSSFDKAQGVYIAKIKLVDGSIVNQKVINQ